MSKRGTGARGEQDADEFDGSDTHRGAVWTFKTGPSFPKTDPNLVGWWKFDGNADDSSGNDRHGSLQGDAGFVAGVLDQAVELGGGGDYVNIDGYKGVTGPNAFSITAWVKRTTDRYGVIVSWGADEVGKRVWFLIRPEGGDGQLRLSPGGGRVESNTYLSIEQWYHVAVTVPSVRSNAKLYIDGQDVTSSEQSFSTLNIVAASDVGIGWNASRQRSYFNGLIDDVRIYDKELLPAKVNELAGNVEPFLEFPADEAILAATNTVLKWTPGVYAADVNGHEVYLSDIFEDVNDSNDDALLDTLSGDSNAYLAGGLDVNTTYYWKVDAVNDSHPDKRWSSEIWSFMVPPYEAWNESPADGATFVSPNVDLSWSIGLGAVSHQVYFGTNFNDVNTDSGAAPQSEPNYDPGTMVYDTNYYWRVDEFDGSDTHRGAVWTFKTGPSFPKTDPNLVGYWKLDDEDSGTSVIDYSGNDHHGWLYGGASYVAGFMGEAVQFDGIDDYISMMDNYKGITGGASRTVCMWIKTANAGGPAPNNGRGLIGWGTNSGAGRRWELVVNKQSGSGRIINALRVNVNGGRRIGATLLTDSTWHHVAAVQLDDGSPDADEMQLYVDGMAWRTGRYFTVEETYSETLDELINTGSDFDVRIGDGVADGALFYGGLIDEVRLYDRALSPVEVQNSMDPSRAYGPSPDNGAIDVPLSAKLTWNPGTDESTGNPYTKHDLYFSTNFEDVNAGTVTAIRIDGANEYTPTLDYVNVHRKSYYWRVDEVNDSNVPYRGWHWEFRTEYNPALVVDPNLLAWYKFDSNATDSSGRGRDLTEFGEPAYTAGFEDQAIDLDGDDDYAAFTFPTEDRNDYTVTAWVRANTLGQNASSSVFSSHRPNTNGFQLDVDGTDPGKYRYQDGFKQLLGPVTTGWVHLAVTCNGTQTSTFYNGSFVDSDTPSDVVFNQYAVGINRGGKNWFEGLVDEVRIYDYVLPDEEIVEVMRIDLAQAWMPRPVDGATGVPLNPTLMWEPGDYAPATNGHKVYFGADDPANMVLVSTPAQPQTPNNLDVNTIPAYAGGLDLGRTYYWAVDEVNGAAPGGVNPGRIWSFTVVNYMVVDDFERYSGEMWKVWIDGAGDCAGNDSNSGAILYEDDDVNTAGSTASMRYVYDNDGTVETHPCDPCGETPLTRPYYSRGVAQIADLPSGIDPNWLAGDARALSLQFYGEPNNAIELLWVELGDTDANKAKVFYGAYDDEDPNDFNDGAWHEWNIALSDFTGVDVTSVNDITIGIGDEGAASPGGTGVLYVDDIRLYPPRCFPGRLSADFSRLDYAPTGPGGDCVIDYKELDVMFGDWLDYDSTAYETAPPNDANLVGHWEFEGDFNDSSSGNSYDGDPCGGAITVYDATRDSNVLSLDGLDDYVDITGYQGITGPNAFSITAWINTSDNEGEIMGWGSTAGGATRFEFRIDNDRLRAESGGNVQGDTDLPDDEWAHVAVTVKAGATISYPDVKLYLNGADDTRTTTDPNALDMAAGHSVKIGRCHSGSSRWLGGLVDDVRLYDKELSQGEILSIVGIAEAYNKVKSVANVYDEEPMNSKIVNFKDYARLLDEWLDEELWP